ncbi:MAG TPA: D-ribose pyranase [Candidatus Mediterraneibacter colneyensis]|nr:D-ribose pyranase [Candidatus Mediterraneibacter colneyensis]
MKKSGIINRKLMGALAGLGHTDSIVITDAGLPIPRECEVVDLALVNGIPGFSDTVKAVLNEIIVEEAVIFQPMQEANPRVYQELEQMMPKQKKRLLGGGEFIEEVRKAKIVVRTAEFSPCCNLILYSASGVKEMCEPLDVSF